MGKNKTAEIIIVGAAAVVKSGVRLEDWRKALNFDPDLGLYDDDDNPLFTVDIDHGPGCIGNNMAVFSAVPDREGYACITLIVDPEAEDKEKLVSDQLGLALARLIEVENNLDTVLQEADKLAQETTDRIRSV